MHRLACSPRGSQSPPRASSLQQQESGSLGQLPKGGGEAAEERDAWPGGSLAETKAKPLVAGAGSPTSTAPRKLDESTVKVISHINFINKIRILKRA